MKGYILLTLCAVLGLAAAAAGPSMTLTSPSFADGARIPKLFTCDGGDRSPALAWSNVPEGARSLVLVCDDPDAPVGDWVHWLLMDIPATENGIAENGTFSKSTVGQNSWKKNAYGGPCPPPGKAHRYIFTLYALDTWLALPAATTRNDMERRIQGHILAVARLTGTYGR